MPTLETLHEKALKHYEDKDLETALKYYNEIIQANPIDPVALSCIQDIYLELDDKFNYYLARANVKISENKIDYAISDTKKAIELNMDDINARRKLARLYKTSGKNLKAIDEFLKILDLSTEEYDVFFELTELYMAENSIDSAISIANRGREIYPDDAKLKNLTAQLYFKANNFKSALEVVEDEFLKVKILLQDEQNDKAKEILDKYDINTIKNNNKKPYLILKAQYMYNISNYDESISFINEYSKLAGADALSFQMKALNYEGKNDEFNSYLNWGFCYKTQNKIEDAITEFNNAYQIKNDDKTTLIELAKLYALIKEKYVSIEFWQRVYDLDNDKDAKNILAEFYYSEGDFKKAEEYGKVIESKDKELKEEENYVGLLDRLINFFSKK